MDANTLLSALVGLVVGGIVLAVLRVVGVGGHHEDEHADEHAGDPADEHAGPSQDPVEDSPNS